MSNDAAGLAEIVFAAYRNERALDVRYRRLNGGGDATSGNLQNYKPMALVAFRRRFGRFTPALLTAAGVLFALGNFAALVRLLRRGAPVRSSLLMFSTIPSNRSIIHAAVAGAAGDVPSDHVIEEIDERTLVRHAAGTGQRRKVMAALWLFYGHVWRAGEERRDLVLHARDALNLILLAALAMGDRERTIWTDDHYQRWSYVLSRVGVRLRVAQHGFIDDGVDFPEPFGAIDLLAVRDALFVPIFKRYFEVRRWLVFEVPARFDSISPNPVLLLASSAPHIDAETAFLTQLRNGRHPIIAVKLHPAHIYDSRRDGLLALADIVCRSDQRPAARVFVSWNSFMEFDYRAVGTATVSIERCRGPENAAKFVAEILAADRETGG